MYASGRGAGDISMGLFWVIAAIRRPASDRQGFEKCLIFPVESPQIFHPTFLIQT
jgi:hypothetical protein